jgi:hypothetical protein
MDERKEKELYEKRERERDVEEKKRIEIDT